MRTKRRSRAVAAAAVLTVALGAPPALATGDEQDGFVLHRDGSKAVPVAVPEPEARADAFDWGDAGIGAGAGVAVLLLASAGARVARGRHAARQSPLSAPGA